MICQEAVEIENNHLIQEALEAFPNLIIVDNKGIIVYINRKYLKLLGLEKNDAIGKHVTEIIPNTRMHIITKEGTEEIGAIMTFLNHENNLMETLVCNRIPIVKDGEILGAVAVTTFNDSKDVDILYKELEAIRMENLKMKAKLDSYKTKINPLNSIIGNSNVIKKLKKSIEDYAQSNLPILITGETGVGKEVFANAIHKLSNRYLNNYVKINCAAIPSELMESELFGYNEGAFSGAMKGGKIGKFELANEGTILLDEISEMSLSLQSKLLRVLQEKEFEKVGGLKTIKFDTRVICSSNENIEELVKDRKFREDLYYRINVVHIHVPPLRDRKEDIVPLGNFFIEKTNLEEGLQITGISKEIIDLFNGYDWPGNVRQLQHCIQRAAVLKKKGEIDLAACEFFIGKLNRESTESKYEDSLKGATYDVERKLIQDALKKTNGNKSETARILNMDRGLLYRKIKKYNL
jgi:transcriptional regulator with PAS, ATPase and Fis domain